MGSIVDKQGETEADVKARIGMARVAFLQLENIWKSKVASLISKLRIFNTHVKVVHLYGAEIWRTTVTTTKRIHTFLSAAVYEEPWHLVA